MKKIFLLFAFVAGFTTATMAQNMNGNAGQAPMASPMQRADKMTERLQEQLKLTPDQTKKVHEIMLVRAEQMEKMRGQGGQPDQASMDQRRAMMKEQEDRINQVLTPQQREQYAKMRDDMRNRRMENRTPMPAPSNAQPVTTPGQTPVR